MNFRRVASLALLVASPSFAPFSFAGESFADSAPPPTLPGGDLIWLWVKVIAFLALLGAGALLFNHYYRNKRPGMKAAGAGRIHLADTCALGNRQYLVVAQFGHERHLLGISPNAINHLSNLRDIEKPEKDFETVLSAEKEASEGKESDT